MTKTNEVQHTATTPELIEAVTLTVPVARREPMGAL